MKKRSVTKRTRASSPPRDPDERLVFLVDENLDSKTIVAELRSAGYEVIAFHEAFARGTADEAWLPIAGEKRWVVLSADARIRREPNEREAVRRANVRLFVLTSANLRAYQIAEVFVRQRQRIERLARGTPTPFIARVNRTEVVLIEKGPLLDNALTGSDDE